MNVRVFAVLFAAIFLVAAGPMLLVQPSALASAGLAAGFALPMTNVCHVMVLTVIGLLAAWLGHEAIVILPLSALLMLCIGAMMHIDDRQFHAVHDFMAGAILLFALSISLLRRKIFLSVPPIALWVYFAGGDYMQNVPSITTPLYLLLGALVSAALIMAIGVSLGVTLTESIHGSMEKLKTLPAVSTFLSLF